MYFVWIILLLVIDQLTKAWAASLPLNGVGKPLGLGFSFTYVQNTGAAFGMFNEGTLPLALLSLVVSLSLFLFLLFKSKTLPILQRYALASILAGAVGNMIDRFRLGYVTDFIHFQLSKFDFPVFNVADMCVVIGAGLLILSSLVTPKPVQATDYTLSESDFFKRVE
jgi:signal peptidase II